MAFWLMAPPKEENEVRPDRDEKEWHVSEAEVDGERNSLLCLSASHPYAMAIKEPENALCHQILGGLITTQQQKEASHDKGPA